MVFKALAGYLGRRGGFWSYVRRVPAEFATLDRRDIVKLTTGVRIADDPRAVRAGKIVDQLNRETESYWRGLVGGQAAEVRRRYDAARKRARSMGLDYVPAAELAAGDAADILDRLDKLIAAGVTNGDVAKDEAAVTAVLGGEAAPSAMLSTLVADVEEITRAALAAMSPDQVRKWRNPKNRAVANLMIVLQGDRALSAITRNDAIDFRAWWQDRILVEGLAIDTANKDIGHLAKMLKTVDLHYRLGLDQIFAGLRFEGGTTGTRAAYDPAFVAARILAPGALGGLNSEARDVVYLISETGLRLSEAANLTASTIHLDTEIPYVSVRPIGRKMKTAQSARDIPLVGVALEAMRRNPAGFPRYRDKAAGLSALVNKYLSVHDLRPTPQHTLYSLRHTFEDRLTALEPPDKIIPALMGHKSL